MKQNGRFCKTGFAALQNKEHTINSGSTLKDVTDQSICTQIEEITHFPGKRVAVPKAPKYKSIDMT